jgi:hypothetical protein
MAAVRDENNLRKTGILSKQKIWKVNICPHKH